MPKNTSTFYVIVYVLAQLLICRVGHTKATKQDSKFKKKKSKIPRSGRGKSKSKTFSFWHRSKLLNSYVIKWFFSLLQAFVVNTFKE